MVTVALLAAVGGHDDFVAGLLIGAAVGLMLGPALRSWLVWREFAETSREDRLTDEVLARMEEDLQVPDVAEPLAAEPFGAPEAFPMGDERRRPSDPEVRG